MRITSINNNHHRYTFKANQNKENNVAILGSSKTTEAIVPELVKTARITREIISSGKNIVTGCGSKGVMGQAYYTAAAFSTRNKDNIPEQNLAILKEPLWGDEDLKNCKVVATANSEANRIEKFIETADHFVIFPGGPGTIQEASTLISNNYYNKENKREIILVGSKYFSGLDEQYKKMHESGLIKGELSSLYTLTDDIDKVIEKINS